MKKKDENAAGCALPAASASGEVAAHDQNNVTPSDFAVPLLSLGAIPCLHRSQTPVA